MLKLFIYILCFVAVFFSFILLFNRINSISSKGTQFTIPGGQFDMDVKVLITEDTSYALRYVRENLDSSVRSIDFDTRGTTFVSIGGKSPIIWLPNADNVSIINHELLHVTFDVMNWAGVPFSEDTEEVYAYQLQYLTKHFYEQINK